MSQVNLHLPETLYEELQTQAEREGVGLEQFIVYSLTRLTTAADLDFQRTEFQKLLSRHSEDEAETALQEMLAARS